uniref:Lectin n=1 Tax=Sinonovacula constricta TaxID=98310 RepID=A0A346FUM6_SINCO|nr:lectin [Sinonovacula constricta]
MKYAVLWLAVSVAYAAAACRDGWMPHGNQCYLFSHDIEPWSNAFDICKILGGFLVEVETAEEDRFLISQIQNLGGWYWIGLTDLSEEGTFEWMTSGSRLTSSSYSGWFPGVPDNTNQTENCVHYLFYNNVYKWNDFPCLLPQKYICEQNRAHEPVVG